MKSKIICILLLSVGLWSCSESPSGQESQQTKSADSTNAATVETAGDFDRKSFVFCPELESHRDELASIVGIAQDPERSRSALRSECTIRGKRGNFVRVSILPAAYGSTQQYAVSFDAPANPLPEVGPNALFVAQISQPHVVFGMGPLILDVDAEADEPPSREKMVRLAQRVKEILTQANL